LGDLAGPMSQQVGVNVRIEAFIGDPLGRNLLRRIAG
jgi:hypothetical protein